MNRRNFCKLAALTACVYPMDVSAALHLLATDQEKNPVLPTQDVHLSGLPVPAQKITDDKIKDYLSKIRHPDILHPTDIILAEKDNQLLVTIVARFQRLYKNIGYGNFGVVSFDNALKIARDYPIVGEFTPAELEFLEMIYYRNARDYGFYGEKRVVKLTQHINKKDIYKVPYSGNYLFKGSSFAKYEEIKKDLGEEVLLTSGIRGLVKQFYLYLNKVARHDGNLSLASRSLAPPGYSYHATGDFDIGQAGFGNNNFSEKFIGTPVFQKLAAQGYVEYRYQRDNMLGVRYEPWHVKL
ncbi:M15 family metallopeptidase [Desulforhopalus sp. IMCC35007]|uniref:M15 family metallopeptidase n=1 Tax=Desulforhopalus sp. IMCC35007 TaxID=2569543 RepID=UPI00145FD16F|nr:M15 family metallopeptidase [Desulforhopalus sp. IMCC35007]